jgi:uncharacterized protein
MDDLRRTTSEPKPASLRSRLYDGLPSKGTRFRDQLRLLIFSDNSPGQIALGAAIGVFLACSPFLGIHTVAALGLALLFRASRLAAVMGTLINNPVTMAFIYLLEIKLGSCVLGYSLVLPEGIWKDLVDLFSLGRMTVFSVMTGFVIIGLVLSIAAYVLTQAAVVYVRRRRDEKHK